MAKRVKAKMEIYEACLFVADMREHTTWYNGKTVGYPCSIKDHGDGTATVISTAEAFREWEMKNVHSSPCVYWP